MGMALLGMVEQIGEKHPGLFRTLRYPEKDHGPEAAVLKKIEAAIGGSPTVAPVPDIFPEGWGLITAGNHMAEGPSLSRDGPSGTVTCHASKLLGCDQSWLTCIVFA
jgi:hypothetical protein